MSLVDVTTGVRCRWWVSALVAVALGPGAAAPCAGQAAQPISTLPIDDGGDRRIAIHGEFGFALPIGENHESGLPPGFAAAGLGAGYQLRPRIELEVAYARGLMESRLVGSASGAGVEEVHSTVGNIGRALARYRLGARALHAVVAVGPSVIFGGTWGTVPLVHVEGGIELRASSGLYLLAVFQAMEPMITSRDEIAADRCVTRGCPTRFSPAHPVFGSRVAAGYVF